MLSLIKIYPQHYYSFYMYIHFYLQLTFLDWPKMHYIQFYTTKHQQFTVKVLWHNKYLFSFVPFLQIWLNYQNLTYFNSKKDKIHLVFTGGVYWEEWSATVTDKNRLPPTLSLQNVDTSVGWMQMCRLFLREN